MSHNPFAKLDKRLFPDEAGRADEAPDPAERKAEARARAKARAHAVLAKREAPGSPQPKREPGATAPGEASTDAAEDPEAELFARAMNDVAPLKGVERLPSAAERRAPPATPDPDAESLRKLSDLVGGNVEFNLLYTDEYLQGAVKGLSPKVLAKLKAGRMSPQGNLDLHGKNSDQAREALVCFIREHYLRGSRCVLLVTGRGRGSPQGVPVLREAAQRWLTQEPLKRVIQAYCTALPRHGGAGAVYILLRTKQKHGKIVWDRNPSHCDFEMGPDW